MSTNRILYLKKVLKVITDLPDIDKQNALVRVICEDMRTEADRYNKHSMVQGIDHETKRVYRKMHEELRRLANKYERMIESSEKITQEGQD